MGKFISVSVLPSTMAEFSFFGGVDDVELSGKIPVSITHLLKRIDHRPVLVFRRERR